MSGDRLEAYTFAQFDTACRKPLAGSIVHLIAVVHQDEEEVEAAHDGSRQVDILLQALAAVIAATHRVGGGQDGGAGIKCSLHRAKKGVSHTGTGIFIYIVFRGILFLDIRTQACWNWKKFFELDGF